MIATAISTASPSEKTDRASRKNRRMEMRTSETQSRAVLATSLMIASYSAMKSGKVPASPTRRWSRSSSALCFSITACILSTRARASLTPRLVPAGRTMIVSDRWSGETMNPST